MWENSNQARKSQRWSAILAVIILAGLLIVWPAGGGFGDWINATNAPATENERYKEADWQDDVTFNMDASASTFKNSGSYRTYYIWENASGDIHYSNITHTDGVLSVTETATSGVNITGNISWAGDLPYYRIYFDYTAKQAYDDNVVRIKLYVGSIYVAANEKARTITLSAGDITFFTVTQAASDTDNYIDENITINVNDLRRAIINSGGGAEAYFKLTVTGVDETLTIAGSVMYTYDVTKLAGRDDALFFVGAIACAVALAGVFLVQPKYSLPLGGIKGKKGGF